MEKQWAGCDASNFRVGRPGGLKPEMIVVHSAGGTMAEAARAFFRPATGRSAHYVVGRDGTVAQHVDEADTAFHAGLKVNSTASLVVARPLVNPNYYSVGVEFEGYPSDQQVPGAQLRAGAALLAEIAARWRIPLDTDHVVTHQAIRASADCPGAAWHIPDLLARARTVPGEHVFATVREVTLRADANIRRQPDTATLSIGLAAKGTKFYAVAVTRGRSVAGNDRWYVDADGRHLWAGATSEPDPVEDDHPLTTDAMDLDRPVPPAPAAPPFRREFALAPKDYYPVATTKDLIVLHFTAGRTARSAFDTWRSDPQRVATAYIVDHDGTICEMFDPLYWAYHLGLKSGPAHDKRSIGIEIANVGPLRPSGDGQTLNWWPRDFGTKFCSLADEDRYRRAAYRTFDYYAAITRPQVDAVALLVRHLSERFGIPRTLPPASRRFEFDDQFFASYRGVATHANFRRDKVDIGPAFDWDVVG